MTTDDERARKIAEAKARAEAARAARSGGGGAQPPAAQPSPPAPAAQAEQIVIEAAPAEAAVPAEPAAAPAAATAAPAGGADERARKIAEAKARAEAARAGRGGAAPPAAASAAPSAPAAQAEPAAPAAQAAPATPAAAPADGDERARRIAEAKARAAAARGGGAAATPPAAATPAPAAAAPASPAAPAAPAGRAAAAAAPPAAMAPAGDWRGTATAPNRVLTARADARAVMRAEATQVEVARMNTRRGLLRNAFWASLGVTLAGFALGFVNFFWPRGVTGFGGIVTVPAAQVPEPGAEPIRNVEGKFWLVNLEPGGGVPQQFQSFAPASESGGLIALYQKCPHLGCTVPWRGDFVYEGIRGWFRCPCHGSTYSSAGIRVFGPAPRPMDMFPLTVNGDGSVAVDTNPATIINGSPENANRAVLA